MTVFLGAPDRGVNRFRAFFRARIRLAAQARLVRTSFFSRFAAPVRLLL